ncbi:Coiled-coil domain-containing protein 42 like-2,Coiled-coil domain-containing protein 42 homolog [Acanthosepion pharaonis]|uniref:Coiled-coil domain-containing protein 42 like-2,Coiled-coil domain-containing protein 42 homolog n=1 Tax=Acanthosepion pharaonis TaxID=158019 RepID=A0A812EMA8_ACAPH|nr:Coiled-coil domain-containing protein 42 like-2,Coiled-coil domain-containing protein 42 homolog [Sepia pharaonis]
MLNLDEYFKTTFEDKLLFKMLEREEDQLTPATRLLEKRRELAEVEQALATQKEEFQMKMESLQQRRAELERKELQLKESLEKFDKFLKENDLKKNRAIKKANDERDMKKAKDKEIEILQVESENLNKECKQMKNKQDAYMIFNSFMLRILNDTEEFNEIRDIISRYDTLISTYKDLVEAEQRNQDMIEKIKQNTLRETEEKHNEILGYNNLLSNLQSEVEYYESKALFWESKWNHIKNTASKEALKSGQIKMATRNLYNVIKTYQEQIITEEVTTLQQLNYVRIFGEDLTTITQTIYNEFCQDEVN